MRNDDHNHLVEVLGIYPFMLSSFYLSPSTSPYLSIWWFLDHYANLLQEELP